ncbi:hypothetical protein I308_104094 [Cryptococcus tetragattii IND107]|uniref:Uncharacterized protein n=1 Tax=Cryptococcus tetragattii IND107 TaxID=1296105 RepID=A0ABR3BPU8_9TREE
MTAWKRRWSRDQTGHSRERVNNIFSQSYSRNVSPTQFASLGPITEVAAVHPRIINNSRLPTTTVRISWSISYYYPIYEDLDSHKATSTPRRTIQSTTGSYR